MLWEAMKTDLKREGKAEGRAEGLAEGRVEGLAEGKFESIKNLMHSLHCSVDQAMDLLKTPQQERQHYKELLAKNA